MKLKEVYKELIKIKEFWNEKVLEVKAKQFMTNLIKKLEDELMNK